jgi:hypothetical protein
LSIDLSTLHCQAKFEVIFTRLEFSISKQCFSDVHPSLLLKIFETEKNMKCAYQHQEGQFYKIGLLTVTWFGERVAFQLSGTVSGSGSKHSLRMEVRSNSRQAIKTFKGNLDSLIREISDSNLHPS